MLLFIRFLWLAYFYISITLNFQIPSNKLSFKNAWYLSKQFAERVKFSFFKISWFSYFNVSVIHDDYLHSQYEQHTCWKRFIRWPTRFVVLKTNSICSIFKASDPPFEIHVFFGRVNKSEQSEIRSVPPPATLGNTSGIQMRRFKSGTEVGHAWKENYICGFKKVSGADLLRPSLALGLNLSGGVEWDE